MLEGTFGAYAYNSKVVGYMERGQLKDKLHWISRPNGTIDGLMIFGPDGRLHVAEVYGAASPPQKRPQVLAGAPPHRWPADAVPSTRANDNVGPAMPFLRHLRGSDVVASWRTNGNSGPALPPQ